MSILVRKINKTYWLQNNITAGEQISADAITNCCKTTHNALSVWKIDSESDLNDAILAIASGQDHLTAIDIVMLSQEYLTDKGLEVNQCSGRTAVAALVDRHYDISNLSYEKIGVIANHIVEKFKEKKVIRYTLSKLKDILKDAVNSNRLDPDQLSHSVKQKISN